MEHLPHHVLHEKNPKQTQTFQEIRTMGKLDVSRDRDSALTRAMYVSQVKRIRIGWELPSTWLISHWKMFAAT